MSSTATKAQYPDEIKNAAKSLFLRRYGVTGIADMLNVPERTVYDWKKKGLWDDMLAHESKEQAIGRRIALLVERDQKSATELKELEALISGLERLQVLEERKARAKAAPSEEAGAETRAADAPQQVNNRKRPSNKKRGKNDVRGLDAAIFREKLHSKLFGYQNQWNALKYEQRNRMLLKSRQIGFTYNEALTDFEDACLSGDNQIFLSATRAQANVFRDYIVQFAAEELDITLGGNPIRLQTDKGFANLYFLSNNSKSAQSYHGHVTIDEFFWISKFDELFKLATGMAAHKKWRRTLLSTPSIISHQAYPHWSGGVWQKRFKNPRPWPSFKELRGGVLCPDTWYRKIITLQDAEQAGCDLFDIKQLKLEYAPEVFRQLFECRFIDDAAAVFMFELLQNCMSDPAEWEEFKPDTARPAGNRPVWGGYDPAHSRDDASFAILLPPLTPGGAIKVLERHRWVGISYIEQVKRIRELAQKYNFSHLAVDATGPGIGAYEQIRQFLPFTVPVAYAVQSKARLVLKAMEVMQENRLFFDAADLGIAQAFLTVRQCSTESGVISYKASRSAETGHGDVAWAIMNALSAEPLAQKGSGVIISIGN